MTNIDVARMRMVAYASFNNFTKKLLYLVLFVNVTLERKPIFAN